jgi:hypothetical protein
MARISFYVLGVGAGLAATIVWINRLRAMRPVPVKQAAAMLQEAWADHRTRA